jgi:hypothetical protein
VLASPAEFGIIDTRNSGTAFFVPIAAIGVQIAAQLPQSGARWAGRGSLRNSRFAPTTDDHSGRSIATWLALRLQY